MRFRRTVTEERSVTDDRSTRLVRHEAGRIVIQLTDDHVEEPAWLARARRDFESRTMEPAISIAYQR
ncbi:MAG TPA: hypothetical protein VFA11_08125 [Acidimicrobiales bacterium]|nr:hypothetical protein [Acidimicrobiales bacterium]